MVTPIPSLEEASKTYIDNGDEIEELSNRRSKEGEDPEEENIWLDQELSGHEPTSLGVYSFQGLRV